MGVFHSLKFYKWYQIAQSVTFGSVTHISVLLLTLKNICYLSDWVEYWTGEYAGNALSNWKKYSFFKESL